MNSGIYKITNTITGKIYVGSAKNFAQRWGMHLFQLRRGRHHSTLLQRSFDKHGEAAFTFTRLLECEKCDLILHEQQSLETLKPYDPAIGYNICKIAGSSAGRKMTEKALALQRVRMEGNTYTLGFKHSEESKAKMSEQRIGNKNAVGNQIWLGRKHTEETKARLSEVARNRPPMSEEQKVKTSQTLKATYKKEPRTYRPVSDETREKMRLAHLGKSTAKKGKKQPPHSEETKRKISEAMASSHAKRKKETI